MKSYIILYRNLHCWIFFTSKFHFEVTWAQFTNAGFEKSVNSIFSFFKLLCNYIIFLSLKSSEILLSFIPTKLNILSFVRIIKTASMHKIWKLVCVGQLLLSILCALWYLYNWMKLIIAFLLQCIGVQPSNVNINQQGLTHLLMYCEWALTRGMS